MYYEIVPDVRVRKGIDTIIVNSSNKNKRIA